VTSDAGEREKAREVWLSSRVEDAIDPAQPIIDCHHHLWDRQGHTYLGDQFLADASGGREGGGHKLRATVYVECLNSHRTTGDPDLRPVGETEFVVAETAQLREQSPGLCDGIVGYADLALGRAVDRVLDAHETAGEGRFKGIRYATACDPDPKIHSPYKTHPGMLGEQKVRDGVRVLGRRNLSLDVWVYFHQIGEVGDLADACPDTSIILNHCGGPIGIGPYREKREEVFALWRKAVLDLAGRENVFIKFGGLAMALAGFGWHRRELPPSSKDLSDAWRPYFETCLETFGAERLMFESNFPVDRVGCSYTILWNAFKRLAADLSDAERSDLLAGTAARVYRL
jgi:predicted TIM-barrel fold metal-dependent hydrolase